jgi:hypothetical protein
MAQISKCGEAFRRRYIEGEKGSPSVRMVIGTAVDRAVAANLRNKLELGQLMDPENVKSIARDTLVNEWSKGVEVSEEDAEEGLTASKDSAIDTSVAMAEFHHYQVAPAMEPVYVARRWVIDIQGLSVQLAGEIDLQTPTAIRDLKSSAKSPVKTLADTSQQLTTYALAAKVLDGKLPEAVALDYVVRTPKKRELKYVELVSARTDADLKPLLERVSNAARLIEAGVFAPADPSFWACSKKYCSFWPTCRYASRPVSISVPKEAK